MAKGKYEYWLSQEGLLKIEGWARDGLIDEQIAHNIGIKRQTLYDWANRFPAFSDTLKRGKEVVDIQVENALLKRALGYSSVEIIKERIIDSGQKKRHGGESELTEKEWEFSIRCFNHRCCYCGKDLKKDPTKDHIKPLNKGGDLSRENIVPCCRQCNSSKHDNDMETWYKAQPFYKHERLQKILDYISFVSSLDDLFKEAAGELVVTKEVVREVPPDTTAQIFWLKNRKPSAWRDRKDVDITGAVPVIISGEDDIAD